MACQYRIWPFFFGFLLLGFGLAPSPSYAQEFSAEQTTITQMTKEVGILYHRPDRWRLEVKGEKHTDISIFRLDKKVIWILLPKEKEYMEASLTEEDVPLPARIVGEVDRAVVGQEEVEGFTCDKLVVRYSKENEVCEMIFWVSRQLGVPLRSEAPDLGWKAELKNIKLGAQPDEFFEIPPGYEMFNPPSDVLR
jgi:outer membrane lipoprotein-sorting protein